MSNASIPSKLSREEIAKREIGVTDVSVGLSWVMTALFLMTLVIPSTMQLYLDLRANGTNRLPACLQLFNAWPDVVESFHANEGQGFVGAVMAANRRLIRSTEEYERQLESNSLLTQHLLAPTQYWLTAATGLGNEKAFIGRDGWLFYRADVEYLTGAGFLDSEVLRRRSSSGAQHSSVPRPDPRPTIIEFHQQLAERGIQLVVIPMPAKSSIHPERLTSRFEHSHEALQNPSFDEFRQDLESAGVLVFDPCQRFADCRQAGIDQFLRTDTHWTPQAMQFIARELAGYLQQRCGLQTRNPIEFPTVQTEVTNLGDIATMLHLPSDQTLFHPETVQLRRIHRPDGSFWHPDPASEVLLLGDSYTNIYSLPEMNWGRSAGFAEQLSFELRQSVDSLTQNDGGSHAVRQTLFQELAQGNDRLAGKRVVVWEFACRELSGGDWKMFPMPKRTSSPKRNNTLPPAFDELLVNATVRAAAGAPAPGSVPYKDAVTGIHLAGVQAIEGTLPDHEIVVYTWGMRDNQLLSAAHWASGQSVKLRIKRWDSVRQKYERFNRIDVDDPDFRLIDLPIYWAEVIQ